MAKRVPRARLPPQTELVPPWQAVDWPIVVVLVFLIMCFFRHMMHANAGLN